VRGALTAAIVVAGLQLTPTAASAQDVRPCVSAREFHGVHYAQTRAELEARWEVQGLGRRVNVPVTGSATAYPRCGERMRDAWFGVSYVPEDGRLYGYTLVAWHAAKPAPVEQPAPDPEPCPECTVVSARVSGTPALRKLVRPNAIQLAAARGNVATS
jgi:hypothetical protein